ncbi:MAG: hypothetical protein IK101_07295 [Oscillospiraceae bacterium]|nr:hypothetical protein [Oscillospiraceae bacterium]
MKLKRAALILLAAALALGLCACVKKPAPKAQTYKIDFGGSFSGERDEYEAGEKVRIKVPLATDTDYSFRVDGEYVSPEYSSSGAYLIYEFIMPDHDVTVEFSSRNSMVYVPVAPDDTEGTLLYDYYTTPTAIVGDAKYDEITVNESEGMLFINVYSGSSTEGTTTSHKAYWAPYGLTDMLEWVVNGYKMAKWNSRDGVGMTGKLTVFKFPGADGMLIRVTSENMPENGEDAFNEIYTILSDALSDAEFIR